MGGHISVKSVVGVGSEFLAEIPTKVPDVKIPVKDDGMAGGDRLHSHCPCLEPGSAETLIEMTHMSSRAA
jgi:hypothetical protein